MKVSSTEFEVPRKLAVLLCGIICFVVGALFPGSGNLRGKNGWILSQSSWFLLERYWERFPAYYVLGYKEIRRELEQGRTKSMPSLFGKIACGIYVPLTIIVFVLGIIYKGLDNK